ncbi:hypothetical protein [Pseudophaeobacter sp. A-200-2]|uniref:hypothetical protein n=1 Tax=Pseudophaeobacter sp. A-200-2 TaxID=3098145 RepID=UPI0034D3D63E
MPDWLVDAPNPARLTLPPVEQVAAEIDGDMNADFICADGRRLTFMGTVRQAFLKLITGRKYGAAVKIRGERGNLSDAVRKLREKGVPVHNVIHRVPDPAASRGWSQITGYALGEDWHLSGKMYGDPVQAQLSIELADASKPSGKPITKAEAALPFVRSGYISDPNELRPSRRDRSPDARSIHIGREMHAKNARTKREREGKNGNLDLRDGGAKRPVQKCPKGKCQDKRRGKA